MPGDTLLQVQAKHLPMLTQLSLDADFFYGFEQDATYFYFNVVPQFQTVNNGNWKRIEQGVRGYAK